MISAIRLLYKSFLESPSKGYWVSVRISYNSFCSWSQSYLNIELSASDSL